MNEWIKPSEYARMMGIHYRTAVRHFNLGYIDGYKDENTGTIYLKNPKYVNAKKDGPTKVVLYARVSSTVNRASLDGQIERMRQYAAAKGYVVVDEVKEIASGLNDSRRKLNSILKEDNWDVLLVEHKDRLTRFGFNYFSMLEKSGQRVEVINIADNKDNEIMDDFIAIITSFCGKIYGSNRKKKTETIIKDLKAKDNED